MATMITYRRAERVRISAYDRWLVAIGALKLMEAALFVALGVGMLRLLHMDLVDQVTRLLTSMRFDPEGRFVSAVLDRVALINPLRLKLISAGIFAHAALDILEGTGLILRKIWAEFVTIAVSALFLPVEFFELAKHVTWVRIGITVVNLVVVVYLVFHVQMRIRQRRKAELLDCA
ncbi:MAG TPA: DUF2127 domain-containing protein [Silvibacterium sp.]|nr:DUF2127 domain-containing protein [Silvibacterium sp.]